MSSNLKNYVIIIGAGPLVFPAYKIAREDLGLGIIAFDWDEDAVGMKYADVPVVVSTKDIEGAVAKSQALARNYNIQGVFTCGADVEVTVSAISEALNLPGIPLVVARNCNDKIRMHHVLDQAGFKDKAEYQVVHNVSTAIEAVHNIGLPCVLKPVANCASRGVQRIESIDDVVSAFQLAHEFNLDTETGVIIEQALDGSKHTVEMIAWQGKRYLLSIIDTHYISDRWPCETGLNTTMLSQEQQEKLYTCATKVADLIGIDFGAHKVDVNLDKRDKVTVIELTARLSGGFHCQYASPLAYGSNDIRAALKLAVGMPLDKEDIRHKQVRGSAVKSLFPKPGRITNITGVNDARNSPGVADVIVWKSEGDIAGPYYNSADRFAYVITSGDTTTGALDVAEVAASKIKIETEVVNEFDSVSIR